MYSKYNRIGMIILIIFLLVACSPPATPQPTATSLPSATPEPTATVTPTATASPTVTVTPTATQDAALSAKLTHQAIETIAALSARQTQQSQQTAAALAVQETQQVEDALWSQLVQDGVITLNKGRLYEVEDFEYSWAQRDWYQWLSFDYHLGDFVIMTHVEWESAQNYGLAPGGCGFVMRLKDENNHLVVFLGTNNGAELGQTTPRGYENLNWRGAWVNPDLQTVNTTEGSADFVVVVEKEIIIAYINGVKAYRWVVARTDKGDIGYTIISGTNKDFGTYCKMTNTHIWELEE